MKIGKRFGILLVLVFINAVIAFAQQSGMQYECVNGTANGQNITHLINFVFFRSYEINGWHVYISYRDGSGENIMLINPRPHQWDRDFTVYTLTHVNGVAFSDAEALISTRGLNGFIMQLNFNPGGNLTYLLN